MMPHDAECERGQCIDYMPKSDNVGREPMDVTKSGVRMELALTTETPDGVQTTQKHSLLLNVKEQRAIVERDSGEPCFRMWVTEAEHQKLVGLVDWTCYRLSDGRWAVWRKESDLAMLKKMGSINVANEIEGRRLGDEVG